MIRETSTDWKK